MWFSLSGSRGLKDGIKNTLVTRLGMQVRAVDAETGLYMTGSGGMEITMNMFIQLVK